MIKKKLSLDLRLTSYATIDLVLKEKEKETKSTREQKNFSSNRWFFLVQTNYKIHLR